MKTKYHLKQVVRFFVRIPQHEAPIEVSGRVREITLFRHSNEIGYLVETHQLDQKKFNLHRYVWLLELPTGRLTPNLG